MSSRNPLLIRDTFLEILDFLNPVHDCTTLLALATTCKEVSEHSLDYMWRILPSLRQLILLLPPDRLERMDPPTPAEWGIINRYSGRVRELAVVDVNDPHSLRFLECISSAISPLFPKLTHLTWYPPHDTSIALVYPLLSPTLTELYMNFPATDNAILQSFLQDYPSRCPALQTITFLFAEEQLEQEFETTLYFASQAVCNLKRVNLQYFTQINIPVDTAALRHLALSPNLRVLDIEHHPSNQGQIDLSPEDMPFRSLEELRLKTTDLAFFSALLRPEYQKFHKLDLRFNQRPTAEMLKKFFAKLASRSENPLEELIFELEYASGTRQQSQVGIYDLGYSLLSPLASLGHLWRLVIRWNSAISPCNAEEEGLCCISHKSIRPLTSLRFLRDLKLHWRYSIFLDDDELAELASGWPSLRRLVLDSGDGRVDPLLKEVTVPIKYITLRGLLILVASCPKLHSISLTIDAREVPTNVGPQGLDVCSSVLKYLRLSGSPISQAYPVASFLHRHFPSIDCVTSLYGDVVEGYDRVWIYVNRLLERPSLLQYPFWIYADYPAVRVAYDSESELDFTLLKPEYFEKYETSPHLHGPVSTRELVRWSFRDLDVPFPRDDDRCEWYNRSLDSLD